jgi:hypothetical protein
MLNCNSEIVDQWGDTVRPGVGSYVEPDEWNIGSSLEPGDDRLDAGFAGCQFRLLANRLQLRCAVNITITGRKTTRRNGADFVRVKIEFVGDGSPSQFAGGWMTIGGES